MKPRTFASLALLSFLPGVAGAQDLAAVCEKARHPAVGSWSQFQWRGGRNDGATLRMSVVGGERRSGADYIWLEIVMRGFPVGPAGQAGARDTAPRIVSKVLVPGFGGGQGAPLASMIKVGAMPAMQMPTEAGRATPGAPGLDMCANARVVGWESVTVPAGTFRALHVVAATGNSDDWFVPDLPFALVKEAGTEEGQPRQLLLVARGTGARSLITETPQPFDARRFAQMMMGARGGGAPPD
jgi:hypothetical protein